MLTYHMEERGRKTKTVFLYEKIRADILAGRLAPSEKMPSKRELAEHLSVSVITVENAYALLIEEGYLIAKERSGYFVSALPHFANAASAIARLARNGALRATLSRNAAALVRERFTAAGYLDAVSNCLQSANSSSIILP